MCTAPRKASTVALAVPSSAEHSVVPGQGSSPSPTQAQAFGPDPGPTRVGLRQGPGSGSEILATLDPGLGPEFAHMVAPSPGSGFDEAQALPDPTQARAFRPDPTRTTLGPEHESPAPMRRAPPTIARAIFEDGAQGSPALSFTTAGRGTKQNNRSWPNQAICGCVTLWSYVRTLALCIGTLSKDQTTGMFSAFKLYRVHPKDCWEHHALF
ncbi:hypothetical protein C8R45DRAFT_1074557 [Mycena sanguinolenta]|nr:hypothetical protein C8R45DRAFT_1074557 [Mycena sanguinolenta]